MKASAIAGTGDLALFAELARRDREYGANPTPGVRSPAPIAMAGRWPRRYDKSMGLEDKARELAAQKKNEPPVDWNAERKWWLDQLQRLHENVRRWLAKLVEKKLVEIRSTNTQITEENIGTYNAASLVLDFAGQGIVLEPKGTLLIGGRGRVDVYRRGARGSQPSMLILSGSKEDATWSIWPATRDHGARISLDEASFESLLESLL